MKPAVLFVLTLALALAAAQAQAEPAATPHELIARLGVQVRQRLESPRPGGTAEDAERAVAGEIAALIHGAPGHALLTQADHRGRTPLTMAVSDGYVLVVQALLTDASVRQKINQPDSRGQTAWMLAQFAPGMTLVACQPGALTLDRYPLLTPYLRRMALLMAARKSPVVAISQALEAAGAQVQPDAARQAWLARCPNATPELRQALAANGDLLNTLVNDALDRQMRFNKAYAAGQASIPQRPPQNMQFIAADGEPEPFAKLQCPRAPRPALRGALNWTGTVRFHVVAATRAGVVEVADITAQSSDNPSAVVIDHLRGELVRTLAGYQCEGDHVFNQAFEFKIK